MTIYPILLPMVSTSLLPSECEEDEGELCVHDNGLLVAENDFEFSIFHTDLIARDMCIA